MDEIHEEPEDGKDVRQASVPFPSCRLVLAVMSFLGFFNVYCMRVNLSVALVAMVNTSSQAQNNATTDYCPGSDVSDNSTATHTGEFNWDEYTQGIILGSFFYGYILTQIPGGYFAEKVGAKWLYGGGILCTGVLTLITPLAARTSLYLFIAVRIIMGIGEGVTYPAMHAMLAEWAPVYERSKLTTFISSGAQVGTVISLPISGLLCDYGPFGGWPSVFYLFGILACLWFIAWVFLIYSTPQQHPRISKAELSYIENSIGPKNAKRPAVPWVSLLICVPFWAILVAHVANNWGFYTLLTTMPSYLKDILHLDMSQNGLLSAIPYLCMATVIIGGGQVADWLRVRRILSTTTVRKLATALGLGLPALALAVIGYASCSHSVIVALLSIAVGTAGFCNSGFVVNILDMAPVYAGTILGITNAAATIPGFVGPQVVGAITNHNPSRPNWQIVFWISSAVYIVGMLVYVVFASSDIQSWANPAPDERTLIIQDGEPQQNRDVQTNHDPSD